MNLMTKTLAAIAISAVPFAASAATFDFADMADDFKFDAANSDNHEGSFDDLVDYDASRFTSGGVTITSITGGKGQHAFFDGSSNSNLSNPAGLGVCSSGFSNTKNNFLGNDLSQCSSNGGSFPSDDNVAGVEVLTINFDVEVEFTDLLFRRANHDAFNGEVEVNNDDGLSAILTIVGGLVQNLDMIAALKNAVSYSFNIGPNSSPDSEFYIASATVAPVPLPATFGMLMLAIGGLGVARRRKKA